MQWHVFLSARRIVASTQPSLSLFFQIHLQQISRVRGARAPALATIGQVRRVTTPNQRAQGGDTAGGCAAMYRSRPDAAGGR